MKKILILTIAAVLCLCSCMERVEDYIYTIGFDGMAGTSIVSSNDPEGMALINEFKNAVDAYKSKNVGNWQWVETIYGGNTSKADAAAKKTYDKYNADIKSLFDTYQAKFNALPDKGSVYEASYDFTLYRTMGGNETLASTKYSISFGKL